MSNYNKKPWFKKKQPSINPKTVQVASKLDFSTKHGYPGFNLYFPDEDKIDIKKTLKNVKAFETFIERNQSSYCFSTIEREKHFIVDFKILVSDDEIIENQWPDIKNEITTNPEYCLDCMGLAMHNAVLKDFLDECGQTSLQKKLGIIRTRLINYEPIILLKDIKVHYYGKLVSVRGTVIKAGNVKIVCNYMTFMCSSCTGLQLVEQPEGVFTYPNKCLTKECRAQSNFQPLYSSEHTRTISWQSIRLQELVGNDECENGRVPRTLDCDLKEDLVKSCVPGDDVTIVGILKVQNLETNSKNNKNNTVFHLFVDAISVVNNKNHSHGSYGASERITFNLQDYYTIQKIHSEPNLFRHLVQSLCPNIYGHEMVKAGLLLALFGGTKCNKIRAESHVLLVGDPGLGKSQMLHACTNVAPRGVYVCGNTSSSSGLTVTMTREAGGEYAMEAGALLLADQGCCCIDEFDKMPQQHSSLLEAMEQQSISIAKAGIVCTLPTRTTILAAANPAGGHYNKSKTIAENLKMSSPMLSRFDLIFIILDQPNQDLDILLSKHVLAMHSGKTFNVSLNLNNTNLNNESSNLLADRLKIPAEEQIEFLPHNQFRKYIAYAQKYVNPQLSDEAKEILKEFYLKLRKQFKTGDCTPITTRQLNSLIRLTQARAKLELREHATKKDALDVIEIMQHSLIDIFSDCNGLLDKTRSHNGTGISSRNQVVKLLRLLQKRSENQSKSIFTINEIKEVCDAAGICRNQLYSTIEKLNIQGFLLSKGGNKYQLVCSDF